jgi:glyoxylase-like metal-dependent hydrolase (beta-lactamase superfamily II)
MPEPVQVTTRARLLLAPNPSPMTLEGTNTWLLAEPAADVCVVVDPGPDDDAHLRAIADAASDSGQRIAAILLTHGHPDHAAGAPALSRLVGAPVHARDVAYGDPLAAAYDLAGLHLDVLPTPGHSADSVCFVVRGDDAVLTGDHVLGRGTSVVVHPDGRMGDYLASLERLRSLHPGVLLPGHGPIVRDPDAVLAEYVRHREQRLAELCSAVAAGADTPEALVSAIYPQLDPQLNGFAGLTVLAGLALLVERGQVRRDGDRYSAP